MGEWRFTRLVGEKVYPTESMRLSVNVDEDGLISMLVQMRDRAGGAERQIMFSGTRIQFEGDATLDQVIFLERDTALDLASTLVAAVASLEGAGGGDASDPAAAGSEVRSGGAPSQTPAAAPPDALPDPSQS